MTSRHIRPAAAVAFGSADEAGRRVAGLAAAARIVRELELAGFAEAWIVIPRAQPLDQAAMADVRRLAGGMTVRVAPVPDGQVVEFFRGDRLIAAEAMPAFRASRPYPFIRLDGASAAAEILLTTGKPSDGLVSRWLNRPISRLLSGLLLRIPGARPIHATVGTALLAVVMFAVLVLGGPAGVIAGGLLFHAASVFDGVDGEMARATFRTSRSGAALDSGIDMVTNLLAMLGLAINLSLHGQPEAMALAVWGLSLLLLGLGAIGWRSLRQGGPFTFDLVKDEYRGRFAGPLGSRLMTVATLGTSRDFCALLYLVLAVAGIPIAGLYLFAVVTPVWIVFVAGALLPSRKSAPAPEPAQAGP
ncbi:MAG TPA: CDP-alcohol phosphatidyltransferase family protein [Croceibacterium sp.]|nr:CDP-alcohol phosphatidyltransferase family protein [Croceibacterium sp.]